MTPEDITNWDTEKVAKWLEEHNFGNYKTSFQHHNITGEILLELTYESLRDIGVQKVGDRARILQTIKNQFRVKSETLNSSVLKPSLIESLPPAQPPPQANLPPIPSSPSIQSTISPSSASQPFSFNSESLLNNIFSSGFAPPKNLRSPHQPADPSWGNPLSAEKSNSSLNNSFKSPVNDLEHEDAYLHKSGDIRNPASSSPISLRKYNKLNDPYLSKNSRKEPISPIRITPRSSSMRSVADGSNSPRNDSPISPISQLISLGFIDEGHKREKVDDPVDSSFNKSNLIRVKGTRDQTFVIDVSDMNHPTIIREAIFERFGILDLKDRRGYVLLAIDSAKSEVVKIDDDGLMRIINTPNHPYKTNLTLRKQYTFPEVESGRPTTKKLDMTKAENRIQTDFSRPTAGSLSHSVKEERSYSKLAKFFGEPAPPNAIGSPVNRSSVGSRRSMNRDNLHVNQSKSRSSKKLASFFGERPPDEMIADQLEQFFPEIAKLKGSISFASPKAQNELTKDMKKLSLSNLRKTGSNQNLPDADSQKDRNSLKSIVQAALISKRISKSNRQSSIFDLLGKRKTSVRPPSSAVENNHGFSYKSGEPSPLSKENGYTDDLFTPPSTTPGGSSIKGGSSQSLNEGNLNSSKAYKELLQQVNEEDKRSRIDEDSAPNSTDGKTDAPSSPIDEIHKDSGVGTTTKTFDTESVSDDESQKSPKSPSSIVRAPIKKWTQGQLIGQGAFGRVFHGLNLDTGEIMAVKQVSVGHANDAQKKKREDALRREMELLEEMDHQNIVRYLGFEITDTTFNVFLEYVSGGSIASCISKFGIFEDDLARSMICQILCGLEYLHDKSIIHRDIKAANILIDADGTAKISDFGISKKNEYQMAYQRVTRMSMQGSIYWMAPEVAQGKGYSAKVDIWSLGCLLVEMLTGHQPWHGTKGNIIYLLGLGKQPPIPEGLTDLATDFLKKCFTIDPEARPTATQLLDHPFADVNPLEFNFRAWHETMIAKKAQEDAERAARDSYDSDSDYTDSDLDTSYDSDDVDSDDVESMELDQEDESKEDETSDPEEGQGDNDQEDNHQNLYSEEDEEISSNPRSPVSLESETNEERSRASPGKESTYSLNSHDG